MYVMFRSSDIKDIISILEEADTYITYRTVDNRWYVAEAIYTKEVDFSKYSEYIVSMYGDVYDNKGDSKESGEGGS